MAIPKNIKKIIDTAFLKLGKVDESLQIALKEKWTKEQTQN